MKFRLKVNNLIDAVGLIIFSLGIAIVGVLDGWWQSVGLFMVIWGHNIDRHSK